MPLLVAQRVDVGSDVYLCDSKRFTRGRVQRAAQGYPEPAAGDLKDRGNGAKFRPSD